eukprot:GHRQ01037952.1.p2 GENE.GHRQ01037952.1~~GHRQ01037952.1.p2  ORF type:complete len:139 (-),score=35.20 GHRQ01037952.1:210-626(-)
MPRAAARRLIAQGLSALAKAEAAEASTLAKSARTFSSLARAAGQTTARAGGSLAGQCKCSCGKAFCMGKHFHTSVGAAQAEAAMADEAPHAPSLTARHQEVTKHFPLALGVDDFIARLEMALAAYGFTGDNAIGEHNA